MVYQDNQDECCPYRRASACLALIASEGSINLFQRRGGCKNRWRECYHVSNLEEEGLDPYEMTKLSFEDILELLRKIEIHNQ